MTADPRPVVISTLRSCFGACETRDIFMGYSGMQSAWEFEASPEMIWWWIESFIRNTDTIRRMRRAYEEIGRAFVDLERLHHLASGELVRTPPALVAFIRRRMLCAWFPFAHEILDHAVGTSAEEAAAWLKRKTEVEQWLARFS